MVLPRLFGLTGHIAQKREERMESRMMTVRTQQLRCGLIETAYSEAFATPKCTALKLVNASIVRTSDWVERRQTASTDTTDGVDG
jgi:hypothetical protein